MLLYLTVCARLRSGKGAGETVPAQKIKKCGKVGRLFDNRPPFHFFSL